MNIILLSGGSGKRLWPLSNEVRSKQFLRVFTRSDGSRESMIQRTYRMIRKTHGKITIATSKSQVDSIQAQLEDEVSISIEPSRRDTFPAIALAAAYLRDCKGVGADDAVVVCPVDAYVDESYVKMLKEMTTQVGKEANLVLMGIEPTYPSEKYGYIIPASSAALSPVDTFKEKPDKLTAEKYIKQGALWNAGVFAFTLRYMLGLAQKMLGTSSYRELYSNYSALPQISFDYAVVEKEEKIQVLRFSGVWKDLGTWNTLAEAMDEKVTGNAVAEDCENTHVINELQIPLVALGVKDLAIVATPDGILVADKSKSEKVRDLIEEHPPMYEKRVWGAYQVLDYRIQKDGQYSLTKRLIITPGQHISYQRHAHRTELWTVVDGTGVLILEGKAKGVRRGDFVCIKPGMKHAIKADAELHIIEVQIGDELTEEDVEQLEWEWSEDGI